MKLFKKKTKPANPDPIVPPPPEVKPVITAACGFKYKDKIYNTAKDANQAYQKEKIAGLFKDELQGERKMCYYGSNSTAYSSAVLIIDNHWNAICALAAEKLEME